MKKIILGLLFAVGTVHPISQQEAYLYTGVTGLVSVGLTLTYWQFQSNKSAALWWVLGGSLITGLVWWITDSLTPRGRYKAAKNKVEHIRAYALAMKPFANEKDLINMIFEELYVTSDVPLALAFNQLSTLFNEGRSAIELLNQASLDSSDHDFKRQCKGLMTEINKLSDNIIKALKVIRADARYAEQAKVAEQRDFSKQQLAIQQSMANAQWHHALRR